MEEGSLFQRMKQMFQEDEDLREKPELGQEATELIRNIFRYMDKDARDIMTHRRDIVAIDGEETLEDALKFMLEENHSRFPIYHEDIDEIIGTMHLREAMVCYMNEELRDKPVSELKEYIRPVTFIPESKSIDTLFKEMQAKKKHVVIVLDEYGQTSGLVALEEIMGNILDEYDEEEETIVRQADGSVTASGFADLEDLEDLLGISLDTEEYETLNGFLTGQLDRIPGEDEHCVVESEGYRFTVLKVDNNAIQSVRIEKIDGE